MEDGMRQQLEHRAAEGEEGPGTGEQVWWVEERQGGRRASESGTPPWGSG